MDIVGLKLSASFLDILAKVDDISETKHFAGFETIKLKAPFIIQLQQHNSKDGVGMTPHLTPLNIFSQDLKEETLTLKKEDILFFFDVEENLENFYRESIGDVTVKSQKVYMP